MLCETLRQNGCETQPVLVSVPAVRPFSAEFPSRYAFNHCIIAIIHEADTTYYDPTSKGYPWNSLPWVDQGAPALFVRPGSDLISLPADPQALQLLRIAEGVLTADGSFQGKLILDLDDRTSSQPWRDLRKEEVLSFLKHNLRIKAGIELSKWEVNPLQRRLEAALSFPGFAGVRGQSFYLAPFPFDASTLDSVETTTAAGYHFPAPTVHQAIMKLQLPAGFTLEKPCLDSLANETGLSSYSIDMDGSWLRGEWNSAFHYSFYEADSKAELDSLLWAMSQHQKLRVKIQKTE
jgi:hypothetical protein